MPSVAALPDAVKPTSAFDMMPSGASGPMPETNARPYFRAEVFRESELHFRLSHASGIGQKLISDIDVGVHFARRNLNLPESGSEPSAACVSPFHLAFVMPVRLGYETDGATVVRTVASPRIGENSTRLRMNSVESSAVPDSRPADHWKRSGFSVPADRCGHRAEDTRTPWFRAWHRCRCRP